jgi:hypothetical protein
MVGKMGWTFAIPTDGVNNLHFHPIIFDSIRSQNIPEYEIIIATEIPEFKYKEFSDIKEIYVEPTKKAWITKKKNECTKVARYENICYLHDYIKLDPGWHEGYQKFGYHWDVCVNQVLILDSGDARFFDWILSADLHPGYNPLDYTIGGMTNEQYVSGAFWCAKREFMLKHPLNEELTWGQEEDVEWSRQTRTFWNLRFNIYSIARTLKQK